jgi:2-C-methyl-D-erythritol 2,4-cyclodiphosphate synthase
VEGRSLILGGIDIPYERGLFGHSDADVLIHAICDAILGALGLGDIGWHFPDSDPAYKGISSLILLEKVVEQMRLRGYEIGNVDSIIIAQQPKLSPYLDMMRETLAQSLHTSQECINVKATTTEKLGFPGRGEGIAAQAIAHIVKHAEM